MGAVLKRRKNGIAFATDFPTTSAVYGCDHEAPKVDEVIEIFANER
jgi:hypothetical protein